MEGPGQDARFAICCIAAVMDGVRETRAAAIQKHSRAVTERPSSGLGPADRSSYLRKDTRALGERGGLFATRPSENSVQRSLSLTRSDWSKIDRNIVRQDA